MFLKNTLKVKFQDQQLDDYVLENSVLKSKLQSKIDALSIMSKELDKCSMERDRFKFLVEQFKCKKSIPLTNTECTSIYRLMPTNTISNGDILTKTRDHNNILKLEVEMLQSKLDEATGDIEVLRKQLQKREGSLSDNGYFESNVLICSNNEYEQLVLELEKFQQKYKQLQVDYRTTLDEKEELISDRDYYKNKVQRLNQQISYILTNRTKPQQEKQGEEDPPKPIVDIDALITENKYLQERITQLQVEKEIIKRTLTKYKTLLDNRSKTNSVNLKRRFADVMTQKQAREFLERSMKPGATQSSAAEMKSLCLGLFEALNDKSIALQHQRKTNQILANRITELEKTLESWCNGQKYIPIFPSQMLLDELAPEISSIKSEETKDRSTNNAQDNKENDDDTKESSDDSSSDMKKEYYEESYWNIENRTMTKTVLPEELQELVKEALAELKPNN